jgi:hypothetical protein
MPGNLPSLCNQRLAASRETCNLPPATWQTVKVKRQVVGVAATLGGIILLGSANGASN